MAGMNVRQTKRLVNAVPGSRGLATLLAAGLVAGMIPVAASAQSNDRLDRMETQLRALQRAVFPGGDERFFEPEITAAPTPSPNSATSGTSTTALTGMLARLDAIEAQLARLTAATEVNDNALSVLEMRLNALEQSSAQSQAVTAQLPALPASQSAGAATGVIPVPNSGAAARTPPAAATPAAATTAAAAPTAARLAAVQAIAKPATDDAGDDEYVYGFRLWDAGFYPEAQQQLALFLERYPTHSRASYARNLLGRAWLDAGEPRRAATFFFENYQADKQAARAPDSLLYLAESMIALNDTSRACIALAEFGDTYPALATGRLMGQYDTLRGRVDCQ